MSLLTLLSTPTLAWLPLALSLLWIATRLQRLYRRDLRSLPGPLLARVSGLYRLSMVIGGKGPAEYRKLHQRYGPIVRVGPNHAAVSGPSAIPTIYGLGSSHVKVVILRGNSRASVLTLHHRPTFTRR